MLLQRKLHVSNIKQLYYFLFKKIKFVTICDEDILCLNGFVCN